MHGQPGGHAYPGGGGQGALKARSQSSEMVAPPSTELTTMITP
jgi:hypothetical protein